jgi:hypothetical protein
MSKTGRRMPAQPGDRFLVDMMPVVDAKVVPGAFGRQ